MAQHTGNESFLMEGSPCGFTMLDFWQFQFSNIYDLQEHIAEFLVAKALGVKEPHNRSGWTLWDIDYEGWRIEVKETGYYYSWQEKGKISEQRTWSITKAYTDYKNPNSEYKRQNDVYVFCLNTGKNEKDSYPLELENWEFYIIPTSKINEECRDNKTISLSKVQKLTKKVSFSEIKRVIDSLKKDCNIK